LSILALSKNWRPRQPPLSPRDIHEFFVTVKVITEFDYIYLHNFLLLKRVSCSLSAWEKIGFESEVDKDFLFKGFPFKRKNSTLIVSVFPSSSMSLDSRPKQRFLLILWGDKKLTNTILWVDFFQNLCLLLFHFTRNDLNYYHETLQMY